MRQDIYKYTTLHEKIRQQTLESSILYYKIQALLHGKRALKHLA